MLSPTSYLFNKICEYSMNQFSEGNITEEESEQIMDKAELCDLEGMVDMCVEHNIIIPKEIQKGLSC